MRKLSSYGKEIAIGAAIVALHLFNVCRISSRRLSSWDC